MIFVFGSNERGIHGAGAAKFARVNHGAVLRIGFGPTGTAWAIPTKDWSIQTLPLEVIQHYVDAFIRYAAISDEFFKVTRIGCGLAGYTDAEIAPMFNAATDNCYFDAVWAHFLERPYARSYWGTM